VVLIFSQKADDNLASLVKAIDEIQKSNSKLGTVVVGVSGVEAADLEKLQTTHKLTTPLTVAVEKDGPKAYKLNKEAAVTVLVYKKGGAISKNFAFKDTKSAGLQHGEPGMWGNLQTRPQAGMGDDMDRATQGQVGLVLKPLPASHQKLIWSWSQPR